MHDLLIKNNICLFDSQMQILNINYWVKFSEISCFGTHFWLKRQILFFVSKIIYDFNIGFNFAKHF